MAATSRWKVVRIVLGIATIVFAAEALVMALLHGLAPDASPGSLALWDALLLVALIGPAVYFVVVKPHEVERDRAERQLEAERDALRREVQARIEAQGQVERLRVAVEETPTAIVITDAEGVFTYANPATEALTGYPVDEVIGRRVSLLRSGETAPEVYDDLWQTLRQGRVWYGEFINRRRDGTLYIEHNAIAPIREATGRITHFVAVKVDVTRERVRQKELQRLATTDELTGCMNRRHFLSLLESELIRARSGSRSLVLMMLDIDHFKRINDTYGHPVGDRVLEAFAEGCRSAVRSSDAVARIGGEEFSVLLLDRDLRTGRIVAERIRAAVAALRIPTDAGTVGVTVSIGLTACVPGESDDAGKLLARADAALYRAKRAGRDRVVVDPGAASDEAEIRATGT